MYKSNVLNLRIEFYCVLIVIVVGHFHCTFGEKLASDFEYPEIASLVSWNAKNNTREENDAFLDKEIYDSPEDKQQEPLPNDLLHRHQTRQSNRSNYNRYEPKEVENEGEDLIEEENHEDRIGNSNIITNPPVGVGPLKFVQEHNVEYEFGPGTNQQHVRKIQNTEEKPSYKEENSQVNNNYLYYSNGFPPNYSLGKNLPETSLKESEFQNKNYTNSDNMENQMLENIKSYENVNHYEQTGQNFQIPQQNRFSFNRNAFVPFDTKIRSKDQKIPSLENSQESNYMTGNNLNKKSEDENLLQSNIKNDDKWDVKKYFKCNAVEKNLNNFERSQSQILPNRNFPNIRDNINKPYENEESEIAPERKMVDTYQQTLNRVLGIQRKNNENIVKQALNMINYDKAEEDQSNYGVNEMKRYRSEQKEETFDTSRVRAPEYDQENIVNNQNSTSNRDRFYKDFTDNYQSQHHNQYEDKTRQMYDIASNNDLRTSGKESYPKEKYGRISGSDFNNYGYKSKILSMNRNNQPGRNLLPPISYGGQEPLEGNYQNRYNLQSNPVAIPPSEEQEKSGNFKGCGHPQWEYGNTKVCVEMEPVYNLSNTYMDMNSLPSKKPRSGRSNTNISDVSLLKYRGNNTNLIKQTQNVVHNSLNKLNVNSLNEMENKDLSTESAPSLLNGIVTIFAIPTPMTMLPAGAVHPHSLYPSTPTTTNNKPCQNTIPTPCGLLDDKTYYKMHKALPSFVNSSNKINEDSSHSSTYNVDNIAQITPTEFTNMLLKEAISEVNSASEVKDLKQNDMVEAIETAITEHPLRQLQREAMNTRFNGKSSVSSNRNNANELSLSSNRNNNNNNNRYVSSNQKVASSTLSENEKLVPPTAENDKKNEFSQKLVENTPLHTKTEQEIIPSNNSTNINSIITSNVSSKVQSPSAQIISKTVSVKTQPSKVIKTTNEEPNADLNQGKTNAIQNFRTKLKNNRLIRKPILEKNNSQIRKMIYTNDESIDESKPYSQWIDANYDDRNRRGVECGCFPSYDEDYKISNNDEIDSEESYYAMMNKHNPKALISRICNNWVAERESRALLKKESNQTKKIVNKETGTKIKDVKVLENINEIKEKKTNNDVFERENDINDYDEAYLRPMTLDDPELALVRHSDEPRSRTAQSGRGNDINYDDDDTEGVQLVTHTPVKYVKWHNLTSGAFGGFNSRHSK